MSRMVYQDINVSIVPGGVPPRAYLKQWDTKLNTLRFHIFDTDNSPYVIENDTSVSFKGSIIDPSGTNYMVMYNCSFSTNVVTVTVPQQLTLVPGEIQCELCFTDSQGNQTASVDIIVEITKGIPSYGLTVSGKDLTYASEVLTELQTMFARNVLQSTSPFKFKGTVSNQSSLPDTGNTANDTYYVTALGYAMSWNGSGWSRSSYTLSESWLLKNSYREGIDEGVDLNNLKSPGNYVCGSGSRAATLLNSPVSDRAFALFVMTTNQTDRYCQVAFIATQDNNPLYIRNGATIDGVDSWGPWIKMNDNAALLKKPLVNSEGTYGDILRSIGGGNTEWVSSEEYANLSYVYRSEIEAETDLNYINDPGNYFVSLEAAGTCENGPVTDRAYALFVMTLQAATQYCQIAIVATDVESKEVPFYIRIGFGSNWSDWISMNDADGAIAKPVDNPDGEMGQVLRSNGDGTTLWIPYGYPSDTQVDEAVSSWLDEHPEALKELHYDSSTGTLIM